MRERAAALGGTLDAGPADAGGWRVHARLPVSTPSPNGAAAAAPTPEGGELRR